MRPSCTKLAPRARRHTPVALVATIAAFGLAACGESDEDKAQSQVCDARADIQKQVTTFEDLPLTRAGLQQAATGVSAIETDLKQIADAQGNLDSDRKQQVQAATQAFTAQVRTIGADLVKSGVSGDPAAAVKTAGEQLAASYKQALEPLDCS